MILTAEGVIVITIEFDRLVFFYTVFIPVRV